VHAQVQRQQKLAKSVVSLCRVVLNQVAGDNDPIGTPVAGLIVIEDTLQRRLCSQSTQAAFWIGEKMRISKVQNPNQIAISCIGVRLDTWDP
jgi:hypothetical protein